MTIQVCTKAVAMVMAFAIFGCNPSDPVDSAQGVATEKTSDDQGSGPGAIEPKFWGAIMPVHVGAEETKLVVADWLSPGETITQAVYFPSADLADTLNVIAGVVIKAAPASGLGKIVLTIEMKNALSPSSPKANKCIDSFGTTMYFQ